MTALRIELIRPVCRLPQRPAAEDRLGLIVERGRRTVLLGRSGSGKSLLARLALGRLPGAPVRTEGHAVIGGERLDLATWAPGSHIPVLAALRGERVSFVPQGGRENLVPGWSVLDHLRLLLGRDEARFDSAVAGMEALGLAGNRQNLAAVATELSEGMIRRVLVALATARGADAYIIDEPTTGLDPASRRAFADLMLDRVLTQGAGAVVITHDLDLATALGGEALLVADGAIVARTDDLAAGEGPFGEFVRAHHGVAA